MTDLFVSYASEDLQRVRPLVAAFEDQGWSVWWDRELVAGPSFDEKIEEALDAARCVVVVWSSNSLKSRWVKAEATEGLERKALVPLLIDDIRPPLIFRSAQTAKLLNWPEQAGQLENLIDGISEVLGKPAVSRRAEEVPRQKTMRSLAVLPFANRSTSEETGFFADGLSEDILDNLAQFEGIEVASRLASFQFTDRGHDPSIIGAKLGVAYLLEGSVRQRGDNLRITAQLIRTKDGFDVWSKSYDRKLTDEFEMQTAVAANIATITQSKVDLDVLKNYGWRQDERFDGIDPIAVAHSMNAENEYRNIRLGEGGDFETYVQFLKNAVDVDSNFYWAYCRLANVYFQRHRMGGLSLQESKLAAHAAITSAIALAPKDNVDVLFELASIHLNLDLDYARAEAGFKQHLTRHPKYGWSHLFLASIALREGRTSEGLRQMTNASEFNTGQFPEMPKFLANTARIQCVGGDYEGALKTSARGLKLAVGGPDSAFVLREHAASLVWLGRADEAKPFIEDGWQLDRGTSPEFYIFLFARIGEVEKSKKILSDSRFDLVNHFELAMGHLALGDINRTFLSIRAGIEDHDTRLLDSLIVAESWNPIREDPRFGEILQLLDSKVTHTEQYLRDHNIAQTD